MSVVLRYWDNVRRMSARQLTAWGRNRILLPMWSRICRPRLAATDAQLCLRSLRAWRQPDVALPLDCAAALKSYYMRCSPGLSSHEVALTAEIIKARLPEDVALTIARADQYLSGVYRILGDKPAVRIDFTSDCWQKDPIGDRESPHALNRFRLYGDDLARAYAYTSNRKYLDLFEFIVMNWITFNPAARRPGWASMAISLRLLAWCRCWPLVVADISAETVVMMIWSIVAQVRYLWAHLEVELGDNHLIYNLGAIFFAASLLPEFKGMEHLRSQSWARVLDEVRRQHHPDGMNREQSTHYHVQVAKLFLDCIALAKRTGMVVPDTAMLIGQRMAAATAAFVKPNGSLPRLSDSFVSFADTSLERDAATVLQLSREVLGFTFDDDLKPNATENALWALGPAPPQSEPQLLPLGRYTDLADSGYFIFRDRADRTYTVFDAGSLGLPSVPAHGHSDTLSFEATYQNVDILLDSGTYEYEPTPVSLGFRSTTAHSTVQVDNEDQSIMWGFTRWVRLPTVGVVHTYHLPGLDSVEAFHTGYSRLRDPVVHTRHLVYIQGGIWLIHDKLHGRKRHTCTHTFAFAPGSVCVERESLTYTSERDSVKARLFIVSDCRWSMEVVQPTELTCWFSPDYGCKLHRPVVAVRHHSRLPIEAYFILIPYVHGSELTSRGPNEHVVHRLGRKISLRLTSQPMNLSLEAQRMSIQARILITTDAGYTYFGDVEGIQTGKSLRTIRIPWLLVHDDRMVYAERDTVHTRTLKEFNDVLDNSHW